MPTVILDTDFLSSFLKIDRCSLIQTFYQVDQALIPAAVHRELARTDLLTPLLAIRWISVSAQEPSPDETLLQNAVFQTLGAGERACISLAHTLPDAVLLMSDNKARRGGKRKKAVHAPLCFSGGSHSRSATHRP